MSLYAGTSGFAFKAWKGRFYPEDLSDGELLNFYASRLPTVEINNTFYRMPKESVLEGWADQVPDDFRFTIKASRQITHFKRLADAEDPTAYLLETVTVLGQRLGVVLFQLPPNMKADPQRLADFVALIPSGARAAFEFRHPSWSDDAIQQILADRNFALVVAETDEDHDPAIVATADWGYLRLRRTDYAEPDLARWVSAVDRQPWDDTYVYFKHEDEAAGPRLARQFLDLAAAAA